MRFLIVDDDKGWLNHHALLIKQTFSDAEITLKDRAYKGYEEIVRHPSEYFDVILTDMQMEHVDDEHFAGEWLMKKIFESQKCQNAKIIIISGVYNIKTIAETFNVDYISKTSLIASPLMLEYKLKEL